MAVAPTSDTIWPASNLLYAESPRRATSRAFVSRTLVQHVAGLLLRSRGIFFARSIQ